MGSYIDFFLVTNFFRLSTVRFKTESNGINTPSIGGSPGDVSEEPDVGEAKEGFANEL